MYCAHRESGKITKNRDSDSDLYAINDPPKKKKLLWTSKVPNARLVKSDRQEERQQAAELNLTIRAKTNGEETQSCVCDYCKSLRHTHKHTRFV